MHKRFTSAPRALSLSGVWVPVVTPFLDGEVDEFSLRKLVDHLVGQGVSGLVALGTTGECPVVSVEEHLQIARTVHEAAAGRVPVLVGAGGPDTRKVIDLVSRLEQLGVDGILSVCPYYSRPSQAGILAHFEALSDSTPLPIVLYNIPYRTGANIENATIRALAERSNIIGLKDCCANWAQSSALLSDPPRDFAVLTGEDAQFYLMLALGAAGGFIAAAHHATAQFVQIFERLRANDHLGARKLWRALSQAIALLFAEPNPAPLKYLLYRQGLLASPEVRLPLAPVSAELRQLIDHELVQRPSLRSSPHDHPTTHAWRSPCASAGEETHTSTTQHSLARE
jgi:4-hydroxy-tetrahydrodipicolinate synthase